MTQCYKFQRPLVLMLAASLHTSLLCGCCLNLFSYCDAFKAILIQSWLLMEEQMSSVSQCHGFVRTPS